MRGKNRRGARLLAILAVVFCVGTFCSAVTVRSMFPLSYHDIIKSNCERFDVDETLVYAIIHTESGFDPQARSEAGALGLMQIMPETFHWLQSKLEPQSELADDMLFEPEVNIRYGVYLLSILGKQYDCDVLQIAAYHAGMGSVDRWLDENVVSKADCSADDIPSRITGHYVRKVERARLIYRGLYSEI